MHGSALPSRWDSRTLSAGARRRGGWGLAAIITYSKDSSVSEKETRQAQAAGYPNGHAILTNPCLSSMS